MKTYIWIVTWCIVSVIQDPCPEKPYTDKFGIVHDPSIGCTVFHAHKEYDCDHRATFIYRDSAVAFYDDATREQADHSSRIARVKFDSVKILTNQHKFIPCTPDDDKPSR